MAAASSGDDLRNKNSFNPSPINQHQTYDEHNGASLNRKHQNLHKFKSNTASQEGIIASVESINQSLNSGASSFTPVCSNRLATGNKHTLS